MRVALIAGLTALLLHGVRFEEQHPLLAPASLRSHWVLNTPIQPFSGPSLLALAALEHCDVPLASLPLLARSFPTLREAHLRGYEAGSIMQRILENIAWCS
jgi:hypothetical protein